MQLRAFAEEKWNFQSAPRIFHFLPSSISKIFQSSYLVTLFVTLLKFAAEISVIFQNPNFLTIFRHVFIVTLFRDAQENFRYQGEEVSLHKWLWQRKILQKQKNHSNQKRNFWKIFKYFENEKHKVGLKKYRSSMEPTLFVKSVIIHYIFINYIFNNS